MFFFILAEEPSLLVLAIQLQIMFLVLEGGLNA